MTPHKAKPELWAAAEKFGQNFMDMANCLLELRDRIEALEAAANQFGDVNKMVPAPDGGLMQAVGAAICSIADCGDTPSNWAPEARAAIKAVAEWFDAIGYGATASILRQELERHG